MKEPDPVLLTVLVTVRVFRTPSGPPLRPLVDRTPPAGGRGAAVGLGVSVGRGAAGRAALVAGRRRGVDPGQSGSLGLALFLLLGLRFVILASEERRHVVQRDDFCRTERRRDTSETERKRGQ